LHFRIEYSTPVGRELEKLLKIPITNFNDILTVLGLSNFSPLFNMYDFEGRKAMSTFIALNVIENETFISTEEKAETILSLLAPLVTDQVDGPSADKWTDPEEFAEEQGKVFNRFNDKALCLHDTDSFIAICRRLMQFQFGT